MLIALSGLIMAMALMLSLVYWLSVSWDLLACLPQERQVRPATVRHVAASRARVDFFMWLPVIAVGFECWTDVVGTMLPYFGAKIVIIIGNAK